MSIVAAPLPAETVATSPLPPRTRGLPLIGSWPELLRQPLAFLAAARERHGDIFTLDLGVARWIVLNHPRQADHVLRENSQNYRKGGAMWDMVRTLLGNGLVVSEGDFWLRQRRMMQPQFHRKQLVGLTAAMVGATADSLGRWERAAAERQPLDLLPAFSEITMRVITRALFGQGLSEPELEKVSRSMPFILDFLMTGMVAGALPKWLPFPGARRYRREVRELDALIDALIQNERSAAQSSDSLLAMLVHMVDAESGERMTDRQLRDEVKTFFLAGYETTSVALTWILHLLAEHPEVMAKLQAEIDSVLGDRTPGFADLPALSYCSMVVQEALRLRPPSWWLPRTAIADDVIDGYAIPAGSTVVAFTYGIHHHPGLWENPERFDPERFRDGPPTAPHKLKWMPFGAGQRLCIGKEFSIMEAQLILAMLMQRFTFTQVPGPAIHPTTTATLRPSQPIRMYLQRRPAARPQVGSAVAGEGSRSRVVPASEAPAPARSCPFARLAARIGNQVASASGGSQ